MCKESTPPLSGPMSSIAAPPPAIGEHDIRRLLAEQYGIEGALSELVSERDQNIAVQTDHGQRFVLKIANAAEDPLVSDLQIQTLSYLQDQNCGISVPEIQATLSGAANTLFECCGERHVARLVSFLPGVPLANIQVTVKIAISLGEGLAHLGTALRGFSHPGERRKLAWDMQCALQLRSLAAHITRREERQKVLTVLDNFEHRAYNSFASLRSQLIHNDASPGNVLVDTDSQFKVTGVIDFGDMLRAPLIVDVAIAASYLRRLDGDALEFIAPMVAAYHSITALEEQELALLYDLIRTRLATTVLILWWRMAVRPVNDPYRQQALQSESDAYRFLCRMDKLGPAGFLDRMQNVCSS